MKNIEYPESQMRAKATGFKFYYTGKPCKKGHLSLKYTSSANCIKCIEESRGKAIINKRGRSSIRNPEDQALAENSLEKGFTTYNSLTECPKGHIERYVTTNNCVQCSDDQNKKRKHTLKWWRVKKLYGVTEKQFFKMIQEQEHKCSICEDKITEIKSHIDHCHSTGKVRSLLCSKCNQGIGLFNEDQERMASAINYLRRHSSAS